mgnify:CR=1 FL=1
MIFLDQDYLPSCTSSGGKLQLCKVSSISVDLLKLCLQDMERWMDMAIPIYPKQSLFAGDIIKLMSKAFQLDCLNLKIVTQMVFLHFQNWKSFLP